MYSFKLNEGQHVCTPEGTMYDPYYIRLLGGGGLLRNKTEIHMQHYYQQIEGIEPILF